MNTRVRTRFTILYGGIPIALAGAIAQAQPASPITFLEGGYAELCSSAAHDIDDPAGIVIVGSRVPLSPLELCTMAIREGSSEGVSPAASAFTGRGRVGATLFPACPAASPQAGTFSITRAGTVSIPICLAMKTRWRPLTMSYWSPSLSNRMASWP